MDIPIQPYSEAWNVLSRVTDAHQRCNVHMMCSSCLDPLKQQIRKCYICDCLTIGCGNCDCLTTGCGNWHDSACARRCETVGQAVEMDYARQYTISPTTTSTPTHTANQHTCPPTSPSYQNKPTHYLPDRLLAGTRAGVSARPECTQRNGSNSEQSSQARARERARPWDGKMDACGGGFVGS